MFRGAREKCLPEVHVTLQRFRPSPRRWMWLLLVLWGEGGVLSARAETWYLDLSRAANRGFADEVADDGLGGWTDQGPESDFKGFPTGDVDFLGVPFRVLSPDSNDGKSAVILRGRFRPDWPETATAFAGGRKAAWLYFLHACAWPGTDRNRPFARYEILYRDGVLESVPLRVGVETAGTWGPGVGDSCRVAWSRKLKASAVGVQLFGWPNPHPEKPIESVTLRSLGKMTVPILLAVTGSSQPLELGFAAEEPLSPEGEAWPLLSFDGKTTPPVDVSALLKDSPRGPWSIRQGRFEDSKKRRARWLGTRLEPGCWKASPEDRARSVRWMSACGFNLAVVRWEWGLEGERREALGAWCRDLQASGFTLAVEFPRVPLDDSGDTGVARERWNEFWGSPPGGVEPDLAWLHAASPEEALVTAGVLRTMGARAPLGALPERDADRAYEIARALDFCTGSFDWDEPQTGPKGARRFLNRSVLSDPAVSPLAEAAFSRAEGKPFLARGGGAWPNAHAVEWPLWASVAAAFQDWDGLLVETPWGRWEGASVEPSPYAALWAASSLLFRRGDLPTASLTARVPSPDEKSFDENEAGLLARMAHRLVASSGPASVPSARTDSTLRKVVADNGRWEWQGNIGLFRAGSPRSQALIGFLSHRRLENGAWSVETSNLFAVFALTSLTKDPTASAKSLLVTASARQEFGGAKFNAARTALLSPAEDGARGEPLKGRVTVFRAKADPTLRARAYDATGRVTLKAVPLSWKGKSVTFKWPAGSAWVILESGLR